ncbi:hypothetical protein VTO73DRAFT_6342 [Trametes versicolor]
MPELTPTKKAKLWTMYENGRKTGDIAAELGYHPSTIRRNYAKLQENLDFYTKPTRTGRPRILSPRSLRHAEMLIKSGKARDAADIKRSLFPQAGYSTVRRNLAEIGYHGRLRREKPLLTAAHVKGRAAWATAHEGWSERDWQRVVFSDESKFNLFGSDGKQYCRRRPGEEFEDRNVKKNVKHGGGSLQVWGCLTWDGPGRLHRVEGHMNAVQYCDILDSSFLGSLSDHSYTISDIIFQQDLDPKHTSRRARTWFADHNITMLPWAPSSPDMNIIEHAWYQLDRQVRARNPLPTNLDQLWAALQEEWERLDIEFIHKLYESMPRRVAALKEAKGHYTKY